MRESKPVTKNFHKNIGLWIVFIVGIAIAIYELTFYSYSSLSWVISIVALMISYISYVVRKR